MADTVMKLGPESARLVSVVPIAPQSGKTEGMSTGLVDLEKELSCSICTDILYQPLTLLDCLHTFCGGCLKEWFKWQGISHVQKHEAERGYTHSRLSSPYTCPSCRAPVRETRQNASITTLLEMWLQANPGKDKSAEDKHEVAKHYTKGENVLIDIRDLRRNVRETRRSRRAGTESDGDGPNTIVTQEVWDNNSLGGAAERRRQGTGDSSGEESRRTRRVQDGRSYERETSSAYTGSTGRSETTFLSEHRVLEHQSSLRSLFSVADMDSHEMEQQIMRQIVEEGLLDGIDLSTMDVHQEEELSERIARAFRRRHREQQRERRQDSERRRVAAEAARVREERQQERDRGQERQSRPPVSRPRLLEAASSGMNAQRRSSSQGSIHHSSRPEDDGQRQAGSRSPQPASRILSDLSLRTRSTDRNDNSRRRLSSRERSATNPETRSISEAWRATGVPAGASRSSSGQPLGASEGHYSSTDPGHRSQLQPQSASSSNSSLTIPLTTSTIPTTQTSTVSQTLSNGNSTVCPVPQISCAGCSKLHIEHDLHYVCNECTLSNDNITYALCLRCYRVGKGCHHWLGFGRAATARYERQVASGSHARSYQLPHILVPERYVPCVIYESAESSRTQLDGDGVKQQGKFCDICLEQSNKCHWSCEICNDGEWGYCTTCVNQARHCTHPLRPFEYTVSENRTENVPQSQNPIASYHAKQAAVLSFTRCTECNLQVPPMQPLFHCTSCNSGDYNLCLSCYSTFISSNRISLQNGPQGWRRCPQGHRMLVVTYDEVISNDCSRPRRTLLQGVVGGWALHDGEDGQGIRERNQDGEREVSAQIEQDREAKNSSPTLQRWSWRDPEAGGGWKHKKRQVPRDHARRPSTSTSTDSNGMSLPPAFNVPPSGGYGMKMQALWSRIPDDGVEDELAFPRGAVVEEVVDINGDWCWGVYCRKTGLFPGTWARVV